jgi:hypothetical protein
MTNKELKHNRFNTRMVLLGKLAGRKLQAN